MGLPKTRRKRRAARKSSKNKHAITKQRRTMRRHSEAGGLGDNLLMANFLYQTVKRKNKTINDAQANRAARAAVESVRENTRSISAKTAAAIATPGWGTGTPIPPNEKMKQPFNTWGAADKNISASGVINTTRFSKFFVFLTEQLAENPKYNYRLDDEYKY